MAAPRTEQLSTCSRIRIEVALASSTSVLYGALTAMMMVAPSIGTTLNLSRSQDITFSQNIQHCERAALLLVWSGAA